MKRPTLLCLNNGNDTIVRYVPKPTGGFFIERFEILDRDAFFRALTPVTIENLRRGLMEGQETPPEAA